MVDHPFECKFVVSFGDGHLCHHPQVTAIAQRTTSSSSQQPLHEPEQPPSQPG
jgi:hypothetical protein